jgi:hypothetical protein
MPAAWQRLGGVPQLLVAASQTWPAAQLPQASVFPQPSFTGPQVFPSDSQVAGWQGALPPKPLLVLPELLLEEWLPPSLAPPWLPPPEP